MGSSLSVVYYFKGNAVAWTSDYNGLTIVSIGFEGKRIKEQLTDLGFFFFFFLKLPIRFSFLVILVLMSTGHSVTLKALKQV